MKSLFTTLVMACTITVCAQNVGINTNTPASTLQVVGAATTPTLADGITIPSLTGDQLKAKDNAYTAAQTGTMVYVSAAASPVTLKTTNVTAAGYYYFNGTVWIGLSSGIMIGDTKSGLQPADHGGWIRLDGRLKSALTPNQQAAATALGIGANLPDASNAIPLQNGSALGNVSGSMSKTIAQNQLPNITLTGTTTSDGDHGHATRAVPSSTGGFPATGAYAFKRLPSVTNENDVATTDRTTNSFWQNTGIIQSAGAHTHTYTTSSLNGDVTQQTLDITPKSLSVNMFIYLGL